VTCDRSVVFSGYSKTFLEIVCFYDIEVTGLSLAIVYFYDIEVTGLSLAIVYVYDRSDRVVQTYTIAKDTPVTSMS
jgi:uncharacterized protein YprB with RNaseH-like and TPR domain